MDHTLALIIKSQQGDKEARDTVFEENAGLVYSVAKRFQGRGVEMEDLVQIGSIGLLKAVDYFDSSYDVKFSTYAVPMIAGEIKRYLRDDGMLKVSRSLKENCARIYCARDKLEKELGRDRCWKRLLRLHSLLWKRLCCRWNQGQKWNHYIRSFTREMEMIFRLWTGFRKKKMDRMQL